MRENVAWSLESVRVVGLGSISGPGAGLVVVIGDWVRLIGGLRWEIRAALNQIGVSSCVGRTKLE